MHERLAATQRVLPYVQTNHCMDLRVNYEGLRVALMILLLNEPLRPYRACLNNFGGYKDSVLNNASEIDEAP